MSQLSMNLAGKPPSRGGRRLELAFTVFELVIVVCCLFILTAIIAPQLGRSHHCGCRINCTNHLKQIGLAFRTWALDNNDKYPMRVSVTNGGTRELVGSGVVFAHFMVMSNELSTPKVLVCPQQKGHVVSASTFSQIPGNFPNTIPFTNDNNVSYFVGADADAAAPEAFLCGDANLTTNGAAVGHGLHLFSNNTALGWTKSRHAGYGNIAFADGSAQQLNSRQLRSAQLRSGANANRLAIP